ncbi:MAG: hypothetical protein J5594_00985 [Elusimicrobiaceae bacterium]|nr:hypothetical protein [Elusimicrobiaceae bacterium]
MGLLDGFSEYSKVGRYYTSRISISNSGWISFNSTSYRDLKLNKYQFAKFFFNTSNRNIGIKFMINNEEGSYEMKPRLYNNGKDKALYMPIKGFVQSNKIVPEDKKYIRYSVKGTEQGEEILVVILEPKKEGGNIKENEESL